MCGRYYFDGETYRFIKDMTDYGEFDYLKESVDFYPSQKVPVIIGKDNQLQLVTMAWGYTMQQSSQHVINARSETILEKKMFAHDVIQHRCLIPAKGFYEWDVHKHKIAFEPQDHEVMLMAGIYREKEKEVTIITTAANETLQGIHSRMPLIIKQEDINKWLFDSTYLEYALSVTPDKLEIVSGQIQQSLFV